jgi:glucose-6-phosphate isomerase
MINLEHIVSRFDLESGIIHGAPLIKRYLSDLDKSFYDKASYRKALSHGDPLVYMVSAIEPDSGDGDLHYGLGVIYPGKIGDEYYLTKGHLHAWRPAAEFYIGLKGSGMMLLEDEATKESVMAPLGVNQVVYVPGYTAHRTVNIGSEPLLYLGIYPAKAGHDYTSIAENNFKMCIIDRNGSPVMIKREDL